MVRALDLQLRLWVWIPAIWRFFDFARWQPPPSWIFFIFNGRNGQECRTTSLCQILSKSLQRRSRYRNFWIVQNSGCRYTLIFKNFKFLTVGHAKKVELLHCIKFRLNGSNPGRHNGDFSMAAAAILDFRNLKFLTIGTVKKVELCHHAKFRRNRSNRGRDIAIFWFFQDGGRRHLGF